MITIKNYDKLNGNILTEGWRVDYCEEYSQVYAIYLKNPANFHPNHVKRVDFWRTKTKLGNGEWKYFLRYNGEKIGVCADNINSKSKMIDVISNLIKTYVAC
jgi:hypothetical protein